MVTNTIYSGYCDIYELFGTISVMTSTRQDFTDEHPLQTLITLRLVDPLRSFTLGDFHKHKNLKTLLETNFHKLHSHEK